MEHEEVIKKLSDYIENLLETNRKILELLEIRGKNLRKYKKNEAMQSHAVECETIRGIIISFYGKIKE